MTILQIVVLVALAAAIGRLSRQRPLAILVVSSLAVFWLQPLQTPPSLQFWIPTATLAICLVVWALTAPPEARGWRQNWPAALVLVAVILLADLNRYFRLASIYLVDTPRLRYALVAVAVMLIVAFLLAFRRWKRGLLNGLAFLAIVLILIVLKSSSLSAALQGLLIRGSAIAPVRPADTASALVPTAVLQWLGFSYMAFRLLHTILDRRSGRLPALTLAEFASYAIFFPAFTAGPIDRAERFVAELRAPLPMTSNDWMHAGSRVLIGLFKKFVLADTLAVISLNETLAAHIQGTGWLWLFLYAYALRIFFDFSGYTDMAIGMGRLIGIQMPENFMAPYLKPNLSLFWNSWHITLTQWFRSYFFNRVVRASRTTSRELPSWVVLLLAQLTAMVLIGLWHGIAWSFVVWGAWHGLGLFLHNRWVALTGSRMPTWTQSYRGQQILRGAGVAVTFNYVAVGWLFFNFSSPAVAWHTLLRLFGAA